MGYTNPLSDLPSALPLLDHPLQERLALSHLFRRLRAEANTCAEDAWARRNGDMAEFNRALSTYARHMAILLEERNPLGVKRPRLAIQPSVCVPAKPRNPLLRLPAAHAILQCSADDRRVLAALIRDLGDAARAEADNSWERRKAPMAKYWLGVAKHAWRISRLLTQGGSRVRTRTVFSSGTTHHVAVLDLASLLTDCGQTENLAVPA